MEEEMTFFQTTTDASDLYRPNSAAGGIMEDSTAVKGNLADLMRNATVFRVAFIVPAVVRLDNSSPTTQVRDTYSPF